jgi:hypothetical protein
MADIKGTDFFQLMQGLFGATGSNNRFTRNYMHAIKMTLAIASQDADLETDLTYPDDTDEDIDLDDDYEPVLFWGMIYHLLVMGEQSDEYTDKDAKRNFDEAVGRMAMKIWHDRQDSAEDDDEDMIGTGDRDND